MSQQKIGSGVPAPKDIEFAKRLVWIMDEWIRIPIINKRVGLDPIIGLIPVVGDVITGLISLFIVASLVRHGAPAKLILRMLFNVLIDVVIGGIPVVGDIWDFFFQSNLKNLRLLIDHHSTTMNEVNDSVPDSPSQVLD
ncbi:MAG: hypothetical protein ACI85F_000452 [Bacteroidia bacterium]|jgi:hypothetical protein